MAAKSSKSSAKKLASEAPAKALYRKYRPTSLDAVVGQDQITTPLKSAIAQDKISHAYLFIGPRGTGKTSVARILAHAINGFDYQLEDDYLDIVEIDAASNTGVDNIRELREKAIIAPTKGKYKVYIIDEVHMLTKSAANALLKTLEEPPSSVVFILATTDANKVPITISSRTQVHTFRLADPATMLQHLRKISDVEHIPITDDALELIVRRGGGSFRDSLSILDQITTLSDQTITAALLENALGLPKTESLAKLLSAYADHNADEIHQLLKDLLNTGIKPETIASELIETIIQRPDPALFPLLEKLPSVQPPFPEAKLLLALLQDIALTPAQTKIQTPPPTPARLQTPVPTKATSPAKVQTTVPTPTPTQATTEPTSPATPTPPPAAIEPPEPPSNPNPPSPPTQPTSDFSWETFIKSVRTDHNALALQLQKTEHPVENNTLHLYPSTKFAERILKKDENARFLAELLRSWNLELTIYSVDDRPAPKDATFSQISAIMGNVKEIDADMPF